ncbi:hypothetical protein RRG08_058096 [Elysia crispata]|uniref:Uncharacterized protein n=1 Tax=Elysia crispata TaxID=231223 RepID=A0AAE1CYY5_9GAST|nr:hypothetical protein RRG08_058096 [Elysia crispata]
MHLTACIKTCEAYLIEVEVGGHSASHQHGDPKKTIAVSSAAQDEQPTPQDHNATRAFSNSAAASKETTIATKPETMTCVDLGSLRFSTLFPVVIHGTLTYLLYFSGANRQAEVVRCNSKSKYVESIFGVGGDSSILSKKDFSDHGVCLTLVLSRLSLDRLCKKIPSSLSLKPIYSACISLDRLTQFAPVIVDTASSCLLAFAAGGPKRVFCCLTWASCEPSVQHAAFFRSMTFSPVWLMAGRIRSYVAFAEIASLLTLLKRSSQFLLKSQSYSLVAGVTSIEAGKTWGL